jgi:hypothetical protein
VAARVRRSLLLDLQSAIPVSFPFSPLKPHKKTGSNPGILSGEEWDRFDIYRYSRDTHSPYGGFDPIESGLADRTRYQACWVSVQVELTYCTLANE